MAIVIFSFTVIFALIASGGLLLFYRQANVQRISSVVTQPDGRKGLLDVIEPRFSMAGALTYLGRAMPHSQAETSVMLQRLVRAGYRSSGAVRFFRGTKILVPLILVVVAL